VIRLVLWLAIVGAIVGTVVFVVEVFDLRGVVHVDSAPSSQLRTMIVHSLQGRWVASHGPERLFMRLDEGRGYCAYGVVGRDTTTAYRLILVGFALDGTVEFSVSDPRAPPENEIGVWHAKFDEHYTHLTTSGTRGSWMASGPVKFQRPSLRDESDPLYDRLRGTVVALDQQ
jgi:hypothetical protein